MVGSQVESHRMALKTVVLVLNDSLTLLKFSDPARIDKLTYLKNLLNVLSNSELAVSVKNR
jgi:hypothetical protein